MTVALHGDDAEVGVSPLEVPDDTGQLQGRGIVPTGGEDASGDGEQTP